jgi:drug/metabolite transporter (DMT)-like permease
MTADAGRASSSSDHRLGVLLVAASALAWSFSGVFARLLTVDVWTAVLMRSAFGALYMAIGLALVHRGRMLASIRSIGWTGIFVAACGGISMVALIGAFFHTSVANVSVIYATSPFLAAALGWFVLGERVALRTVIAAATALVGVAIMVGGSFVAGHIVGDLSAFVMAASFAVMAVMIRKKKTLEMLPTNILVCIIAGLIAAPFARPMTATPVDLVVLAAFAFTSIALAFFLFLAGARRIPAAETGLITTLEVPLSPIWVYLLFGENPGLAAIVGGAIVFLAVVWQIGGERRAGGER